MKHLTMAVLFALAGTVAWADVKPGAKQPVTGPSYLVDAAASKVEWLGKKVTGQHHGTIQIKNGTLQAEKGALTGGTIVIDMPTLKDVDLTDQETNDKLTGHLKSGDFFDVAKYPTSTFKITKVAPLAGAKTGEANVRVTGNLTIRGATNPITFPATVAVSDSDIKATAKGVKVDRTQYGLRYGSGKFFAGLGDKVIYDEFFIDFDIIAKK